MTTSGSAQPNAPTDAQKKVDAYLSTLRQRLRGLNDQNAREIVEELRSHIKKKSARTGRQPSPLLMRPWGDWAIQKNWPANTRRITCCRKPSSAGRPSAF